MKLLNHLLAVLAITTWACAANASPLSGEATVYDTTGTPFLAVPITGDLDLPTDTMNVDPFEFFGFPFNTTSVELLGEGTHERTDPNGTAITATVNAGQLGGYLEFEWNSNSLGTFMVWDVTSSSSGGAYTTVDSDGDSIPGHALASGPFVGSTVTYDFVAGDPPPGVTVSINVTGGTTQECNTTGGSDIVINAEVNLVGGATLGGIDWAIDGDSAGSGTTISPFLSLSSHTIDVTATTSTGESGTDSITVNVEDTLPPNLEVAFLDRTGTVITSASAGTTVTTRIATNDICDPEPLAEGAAVPVFEISDGDTIKLTSKKHNNVKLPTTAIELSASASDASGNTASGLSVLSITD